MSELKFKTMAWRLQVDKGASRTHLSIDGITTLCRNKPGKGAETLARGYADCYTCVNRGLRMQRAARKES